MKKHLLLPVLILLIQFAFSPSIQACTCAYIDVFCGVVDEGQNIVRAEIIDSVGVQLRSIKIIDNINLETTKDTIIIQGGNGANCGENLNQFNIGDTLVLALQEDFPSMENYFLEGDCGPHFLRYFEGRVSGNITPDSTSMSYEKFVSDLQTCIDFNINTNNITASQYNIQLAPIPVHNELRISLEDNRILQYEVYNISGQLITSKYGLNEEQLQLNWDHWEAGLYVIRLVLENGVFSRIVPKS